MDFHFDLTISKHTSLVVTTFQTAGTLLIALLLRMLTRGIPGRFLQYWAMGWVCLALGLLSFNLSVLIVPLLPQSDELAVRRPALAVSAVFQYAFGFSLWAGCRMFARGILLTARDWWLFAPAASFGIVAPLFLPNIDYLFPFHSTVFGGFCLLALLATWGCKPESRETVIGLRMTQFAIACLVVLLWHYALVMGWLMRHKSPADLEYLDYSALYYALAQTLLGFGMVVLGTDSVRREVEAKNRELAETNRRLAEASEQLAAAARTDPLTGLLNRRALDAMLAERKNLPFAGTLAMVDLNDLKKLNDAYGHGAGDAAIQLVARALRAQFRITDPIFRIGGDEFLVILEGGQAAELNGRLHSLDRALMGLRVPGVPTPIDLVVSWGMDDFDATVHFLEAMASADVAMYACKAQRKVVTL